MEDKYRKLKCLGKGATAEVYLVEETASGEQFAMKVGGQGDLLKWEAKLLYSLQCDDFPAVKEYIRENREYLVMEYIKGTSLQEMLDQGYKPEAGEIVYIMENILKALDKMHKHEPAIIYRDLKPANVMLDAEGRVRLIDLGAACYQDGTFGDGGNTNMTQVGTYGYAAPEQFWQGVPDKTCDIYAAGKIFAYLLSGKDPAEPPYDMEGYCKRLKRLPESFAKIIARCLAVAPLARYTDCSSLLTDINRAFDENSKKKLSIFHKNGTCIYQKCIWKSEYRRIF